MVQSAATDDRGPQIIATGVATAILATVAVGVRIASRKRSRAGLWWDDWTICASLFFALSLSIETIYLVSIRFGKHLNQAKAPAAIFVKYNFIQKFSYNIGLTLAKLSVLLFYARCFGFVSRPFRFRLCVVALVVIAWGIIFVCFDIFSCTPSRRAWDSSVPGHCIELNGVALGSTVSNVVVDLVLLLLPLPMLWRLQTSLARKLSLTAAFTLGYCVVLISIWRLVTLISLIRLGDIYGNDLTWTTVTHQLLYVSETPFAIISACIPCSLHLLKEAAEKTNRLLTTVQDRLTSVASIGPESQTQTELRNAKPGDSGGFVQLDDSPTISIAIPSPRLEVAWQENPNFYEAKTRSDIESDLSSDQAEFR